MTDQEKLVELEAVYHARMTGKQVTSVGHEGVSASYDTVPLAALKQEIEALKRKCGGGRRRAVRVGFGGL